MKMMVMKACKTGVFMEIDLQANLRKYYTNIRLSGGFIIVYIFWQILKMLMLMFFGYENVYEFYEVSKEEYESLKYALIIFTLLIYLVFFLFHFYVGIGAFRFRSGRKIKKRFIVATVILLVMSVWSAFHNFYTDNIDDTVIASFILDATLCFILSDLLITLFKIKKSQKLVEG